MATMSATPRNLEPDELLVRLQQQEMVAEFGMFALGLAGLDAVLTEACRVASLGLRTDFAKVLKFRQGSADLLVIAGVGWHTGVVGNATLGAGLDSPAGYALQTGRPVVSNNLDTEERFRTPRLLADHGIHSAINVAVATADAMPFGVLEVDSTARGDFNGANTAFMQSLSNVLAAALVRQEAELAKDALIREKDLLMQEVHHRVKNSLQLVRTLLQLQARTAPDDTRVHLEEAAGRIMTIGAVHQRLYEGGSVTHTDAAAYLRSLIADLQSMLVDPAEGREIIVLADALRLPADQITPLGLITSELVTNALKHGAGRVLVSLRPVKDGLEIRVEDEGPGFAPEFEARPSAGLGMRLIAALAKGDPTRAVVIDRTVPHGCVVATLRM